LEDAMSRAAGDFAAATMVEQRQEGEMSQTEAFLASMLPRLTEADHALHNGDAGPRKTVWSHTDPVTLFGAAQSASGWNELRQVFDWLGSRFSNGTYEYEVLAAGASGDLGYIVGIEHSSASIGGAEPEAYELRVTTICRRENGEWKVVHRHADPNPDSDAARRGVSQLRARDLSR
jgi:ketosteroid isomerase-like protein